MCQILSQGNSSYFTIRDVDMLQQTNPSLVQIIAWPLSKIINLTPGKKRGKFESKQNSVCKRK